MKTTIIGDVHGCLEELNQLLVTLRARGHGNTDRVVFAGDLIDRGPDPIGVLDLVRKIGAEAIMGNHDHKFLRWVAHEERRKTMGKKNPMAAVHPDRLAQWEAIAARTDLVEWMRTWPTTLYLGDDWVTVHGGFEAVPWEEQKVDRMIRCRFIDEKTGLMIGAKDGQDPWVRPDGSVHWMSRWRGKHVVYGHAVHSLSTPRVDVNEGTECWGIDTGCVFGGRLTALLLPAKDIIQVSAKKQYARPLVDLES